jgi:alanine-synthesizing transaminase
MSSRFSRRTNWDIGENLLAKAVREARANGGEIVDLTVSNPTVCGFDYDADAVLGALDNRGAMSYNPTPRGILSARESVTSYYAEHGAIVDPDQVILTTSTSEAYSLLFRLLCDPGDAVMVAEPSYPLFEYLADLDDVRLEHYVLFYDFGWWVDFAELERRITTQTRALILVHPNNPTGHATTKSERERIEQLCVRCGLALIVDEVFLDYGLQGRIESFTVGPHPCLTFVVSGLSKIAALPQMKVGWIAAFGPESDAALARLEVVADTFLSMNAPAQHALPNWLAGREVVARQIRERVRANLDTLSDLALPVEAGWSAIVRLPQRIGSRDLAERLVREAGVIVHPGSFYGITRQNYIVVSLLGSHEEFRKGVNILNEWCEPKKLT